MTAASEPAAATPATPATPMRMARTSTVPVILAGAHGHGQSHLRNLERLEAAGSPARLAGVCDPRPPTPALLDRLPGIPWEADFGALIDRVGARIALICTPIHTHAELAGIAARSGCHVLLEKPPTATLESFAELLSALDEGGVACQVGFQDLASGAIDHVRGLLAAGAVGELRGIGAAGTWIRDAGYFGRARWAGHRELDGVPVVDGVLSNPLAHAVASALVLDGSTGTEPPREVEVELYRANDIESDDTSCLRLRTARGTRVVVAATLCAETTRDPVIVVHGSRGRIELQYKQGRVALYGPGDPDGTPGGTWVLPRADLLENLTAHLLDASRPLLVPVAATTAFMHVLEAIRTAAEPAAIPAASYRELGSGTAARRVVPGVDDVVAASAAQLALFSELAPAWAAPRGGRA